MFGFFVRFNSGLPPLDLIFCVGLGLYSGAIFLIKSILSPKHSKALDENVVSPVKNVVQG
jgi:hypothetical protein